MLQDILPGDSFVSLVEYRKSIHNMQQPLVSKSCLINFQCNPLTHNLRKRNLVDKMGPISPVSQRIANCKNIIKYYYDGK
jgi:hypothetical protein